MGHCAQRSVAATRLSLLSANVPVGLRPRLNSVAATRLLTAAVRRAFQVIVVVVPLMVASERGFAAETSSSPQPAADQVALAEGQSLFRGLCTGCHGGAGRGGKGPDLTDKRWIHGDKDADIARVIREGVPKTTMKKLGEALKEEQIAQLVLYVRSLARKPGESTWQPYLKGNAEAGRTLFFDQKSKALCSKCHSVNRQGGRVGPQLDHIANRRASEYIMESMVLPSKDIDPNYEAVQVVTAQGTVIIGLRVNETNFSIQIREENGRFHSLLKKDLDEIAVLQKSLMPDNLPEVLTVKELHDLFAFLMSLE